MYLLYTAHMQTFEDDLWKYIFVAQVFFIGFFFCLGVFFLKLGGISLYFNVIRTYA